jgi:hypothetical protein
MVLYYTHVMLLPIVGNTIEREGDGDSMFGVKRKK